MICKNCGANIEDGSVYCTNCGAALTEETYDPNAQQAEYNAEVVQAEVADPGKVLGLISLICGIAAIAFNTFCSCTCYTMWFPILPAVAGIVLSIISGNKSKSVGLEKNKLAKIGFILACIGLGLNILSVIVYFIFMALGMGTGMLEDMMYNMY